MGDCFSISLNITLKNEAAAVRVMQEYILRILKKIRNGNLLVYILTKV